MITYGSFQRERGMPWEAGMVYKVGTSRRTHRLQRSCLQACETAGQQAKTVLLQTNLGSSLFEPQYSRGH